ncbi:MAG: hypothetical protein EXS19_06005 [Pedosphaera sp.]|nr:hypothetical protein [Pedosphaera sp.]
MKKISFAVVTLLFSLAFSAHAEWTVQAVEKPGHPGKAVEVRADGQPVARLVYGDGQKKPYLHVYGEAGELLTNSGLNAEGKDSGGFPHHRGIYIGWKITSNLGSQDLWHLNKNERMLVREIVKQEAGKDSATIVAHIDWLANKKDDKESDQLVSETRTITVSRPDGKRTQVDCHFRLRAARDLELGGDLQHAGIHFRASNEVHGRAKETSYLADPANREKKGKDFGPIVNPKAKAPAKAVEKGDLKWCRLLFPIGTRWYSATELNPPSNPSEELSWRDYGRFGYFFKKNLKAGEILDIDYRFIIAPEEAPATKPAPAPEQAAKATAQAAADYATFVKSLEK